MIKVQNYINGELLDPLEKKYLNNINPATSEVYSLVPDSSAEDVDLAISAAKSAYPKWSSLSPEDRSHYLKELARLIERDLLILAKAESIDNGKPFDLARKVDIPRACENLNYFSQEILSWRGESFTSKKTGDNQVEYSPLGVVATISPWNLPLYLLTWKIAPALAAGNTVVAKPSEITPMSSYLLSKICIEANLPPGVLNIVHGLGLRVGSRLSSHPDIKAVSFTGSTATGKIIATSCVETLKKYSLEMGGKNPCIIFSDCDFEKAVNMTLKSTFSNQGQICLCSSRIFVEREIYDKFKETFIKRINQLKQGDPLKKGIDQGAIVSLEHFNKVLNYIKIGKDEGGILLTGGEAVNIGGENAKGLFIKPTLFEGLSPTSRVNQEEVFGPLATITPFETEEEVISWANSTQYGLACTIWSEDTSKCQRVAQKIESGIVWINTWLMRDLRTPFGGVKESGFGREGGRYILEFFSQIKNICMPNQDEGK